MRRPPCVLALSLAAAACGADASAPVAPGPVSRDVRAATPTERAIDQAVVDAGRAAAQPRAESRSTSRVPLDCIDNPLAAEPTSGTETIRIIPVCYPLGPTGTARDLPRR